MDDVVVDLALSSAHSVHSAEQKAVRGCGLHRTDSTVLMDHVRYAPTKIDVMIPRALTEFARRVAWHNSQVRWLQVAMQSRSPHQASDAGWREVMRLLFVSADSASVWGAQIEAWVRWYLRHARV